MPERTQFAPEGSIVEFNVEIATTPWPGERASVVPKGSRYKLVRLVGFGWDLERVGSLGPEALRLLDSQMEGMVRVVSKSR
jgi:hypothetical protein